MQGIEIPGGAPEFWPWKPSPLITQGTVTITVLFGHSAAGFFGPEALSAMYAVDSIAE